MMKGHCEGCGNHSYRLRRYRGTLPHVDLCPTCLRRNQEVERTLTGVEPSPSDGITNSPRVIQVYPPRHGKS